MDPKSKQEAKTKARSMMRVFSDKMEVTGAKFSGGQFADLEIAVFKATLEDDFVPKEKHVKTLKQTTAGGAPRQEMKIRSNNDGSYSEPDVSSEQLTVKIYRLTGLSA